MAYPVLQQKKPLPYQHQLSFDPQPQPQHPPLQAFSSMMMGDSGTSPDQTMAAMQQLISQFAASGLFPAGPPGSQTHTSLPVSPPLFSSLHSGPPASPESLAHPEPSQTQPHSPPSAPDLDGTGAPRSSQASPSPGLPSRPVSRSSLAATPTPNPPPASASASGALASATPPAAAAATAFVLSSIIQMFGSSMQLAVARTSLLRCVLAIALAVSLSMRWLHTAALPGSPLLLLGCCQGTDKPSEAPAVPLKFRSLDLTQLVPGLRPLLTMLYSMRSFAVGMYDGLAVFVVACAVLQCMQQQMDAPEGFAWGAEPLVFKWLVDEDNGRLSQ
ncbi:MAG: hypothetical protein WDW38_010665 [Sanguina aurantia]